MSHRILALLALFIAAASAQAIVTASSANHFVPLVQLIVSIKKHEPKTPLLLYDLGLTVQQAEWLKAVDGLEYRLFDFRQYPRHVRLGAESYAFKPIIIRQALAQYRHAIWMDAGDELTGPIVALMGTYLEQHGFFSGVSTGSLRDWTHIGTQRKLDVDGTLLGTRNCNAAFLAFAQSAHDLYEPWLDCALDVDCITPVESSRTNHRQDQAALSVLVAQSQGKYTCVETSNLHTLFGYHKEYDNHRPRYDLNFNLGIPTNLNAVVNFYALDRHFGDEHAVASAFVLALTRLQHHVRALIVGTGLVPEFVAIVAKALGPHTALGVTTNTPWDLALQPNGRRPNDGLFVHDATPDYKANGVLFTDMFFDARAFNNQIALLRQHGFFEPGGAAKTATWIVMANSHDDANKQFDAHFAQWQRDWQIIAEEMYIVTLYKTT